MLRRNFLKLLGIGAVVPAIAVQKLTPKYREWGNPMIDKYETFINIDGEMGIIEKIKVRREAARQDLLKAPERMLYGDSPCGVEYWL